MLRSSDVKYYLHLLTEEEGAVGGEISGVCSDVTVVSLEFEVTFAPAFHLTLEGRRRLSQEAVYNEANQARSLACDTSLWAYPTLPGTTYINAQSGWQTLSWPEPSYDRSSQCTAPYPTIAWWFVGYKSGTYSSCDDYYDIYGRCTDIYDWTTCVSCVQTDYDFMYPGYSSMTFDTNSAQITIDQRNTLYPYYYWYYNWPSTSNSRYSYLSFSIYFQQCAYTSQSIDNAVTGSEIIYQKGSGPKTYSFGTVTAISPDCGYNNWFYLMWQNNYEMTSKKALNGINFDKTQGTFEIDIDQTSTTTVTYTCEWAANPNSYSSHAYIKYPFTIIAFVPITKVTWGMLSQSSINLYVGFQSYIKPWQTLTLEPVILNNILVRQNFNLQIDGVDVYIGGVKQSGSVSWITSSDVYKQFTYTTQLLGVKDEGTYTVVWDWTITDVYQTTETQTYTQQITLICGMYQVTRQNTWNKYLKKIITIFDTTPFTKLLETYVEYPACGNSYTVTFSISKDQWVTQTGLKDNPWITVDDTQMVIQSADKNLHGITFEIKMKATFEKSFSADPEAFFSVLFDDPCTNAVFESQSIPTLYAFVDQQAKVGTYEFDLPWINDSVNLLYGDTSPLTESICGERLIKVSDSSNLVDDFGMINNENPIQQKLEIYTTDLKFGGDHFLTFQYSIVNYPLITTTLSSRLLIYYFVEPNEPQTSPLNYQINSGVQIFQTLLQTVEPYDRLVTVTYDVQMQNGAQVPSWISYSVQTEYIEYSISCTDESQIGEYLLKLVVLATHPNFKNPVTFDYQFQVNLLSPLSIGVNLAPYWEAEVPASLTTVFGQAFNYALPSYTDDEGDEVTLSVELGRAKVFLKFDEGSRTFSIPIDVTTESQVGAYVIKVTLTDSAQQKLLKVIMLNIVKPDQVKEEEEVKEVSAEVGEFFAAFLFLNNLPVVDGWDWSAQLSRISQKSYRPLPPEIKLVEISKVGLVRIKFTKEMITPPLSVIQSARALAETQNAVIAQVLPGDQSDPGKLRMEYNITHYEKDTLEIQLNFENPSFVSTDFNEKDRLQIIFPNKYFFFDTDGLFIKQNLILERVLPSQMDPKGITAQLASQRDNLAQGSTALMAGNFVLNFFLSAGLNQMISMVETQQILLVPPLFLLALPANAAAFFKFVMEVAAFDLVPTGILYKRLFNWEDTTESINTNFNDEGFGSKLFLFNIGSILLILAVWVPLLIAHVFLTCFTKVFCCGRQQKCLPQRRQKLRNCVFWAHPVLTLYESYFVICLCTLINYNYTTNTNAPSERFSKFLTFMFLVICIGFPLILITYLCYNFDRLHLKRFKARCGGFYDNLDLKKGRVVLIHVFWFMLRRFILAYICVLPPGKVLFFQFFTLIFTIYLQIIIGSYIMPLKSRHDQQTERLNEIVITLVYYTFLCFTDLAPDPSARVMVGYISCLFVVMHLLVNIGVILIISLRVCREKRRKKNLRKKQQKMIAAGEMEPIETKAQRRKKKIVAEQLEQLARLECIQEVGPNDEVDSNNILSVRLNEEDMRKIQIELDNLNQIRQQQMEEHLQEVKEDFLAQLEQQLDLGLQLDLSVRQLQGGVTQREESKAEDIGVVSAKLSHDSSIENLFDKKTGDLIIPFNFFYDQDSKSAENQEQISIASAQQADEQAALDSSKKPFLLDLDIEDILNVSFQSDKKRTTSD